MPRRIATVVSENTRVTVGLVVTLVSFAAWVGTVHSQTDTNTRDLDLLRQDRIARQAALAVDLRHMDETLSDLRSQMSATDAKVQFIYEATKRRER